MKYGYARVSTAQQATKYGLDVQKEQLRDAGAEKIYADAYTGTKANRPEWDKLLSELKPGDELIVCKLDRIARSAVNGLEVIDALMSKGVVVNILNMGRMDNSPQGKLIRTIFLAFSEFERDMIVTRTQEGKARAKATNPEFSEGRPKKYNKDQLDHAMGLLNDHSFSAVERMTGISKSTLVRESRQRKAALPTEVLLWQN